MITTHTEAEAFQIYLTKELANGGKQKSPEELVAEWRRGQREFRESVAAVKEALEEIKSGAPLRPAREVIAEIRLKRGETQS